MDLEGVKKSMEEIYGVYICRICSNTALPHTEFILFLVLRITDAIGHFFLAKRNEMNETS